MHDPMTRGLDLAGCPQCAAPAEIVDRFVLESTDGPVEHATVLCAVRHRFTVLVERLGTRRAPVPEEIGPGVVTRPPT